MGETYEAAGVSIAAGEEAVERIRAAARSTYRPEVLGDLGGFGALVAVPTDRYRRPVLVSSTDGVGTKLLVALAAGRLDTIGIDLVAMCVDDLVCQGAEPLFLLDYVAVGRLDPAAVATVVGGVAEGCRQAGCALVGGEMAEHPGAMGPGDLDLVGFAVGVVEHDAVVTGQRVAPGDVVLGLPSPGLRSNGYSLARRVLLERAALPLDGPAWPGADATLADELLRPSVVYARSVLAAIAAGDVRGVAHVTGGGIPGNLSRVLPAGVDAVLDRSRWAEPRIFGEIRRLGDVDDGEMARVFNLGLGMVLVVPPGDVDPVLAALAAAGRPDAGVVGEVVPGSGRVRLTGRPPG